MEAMIEQALQAAIYRHLEVNCLADLLCSESQMYASLYLSTEQQIGDLSGPVPSLNVKGQMIDWRFVTLQIDHPLRREKKTYLLGERGPYRIVTMTSGVRAVDLESGLVRTANSVYCLREDAHGIGEPPERQLIAIARTLWSWGLGTPLGVPRV
jgi:hypothetical protein